MEHLLKKIDWKYFDNFISGELNYRNTKLKIFIDRVDYKVFSLTLRDSEIRVNLKELNKRIETTPEDKMLKEPFWKEKVIPSFKTAILDGIVLWRSLLWK